MQRLETGETESGIRVLIWRNPSVTPGCIQCATGKTGLGVWEESLAWGWGIGRLLPLVGLSKVVEACLVPPKE